MRSIYQDRLGTYIGKTQKQTDFSGEKGFAGTYEPGFRAPTAFTGGWKCIKGVSAETPYGGSCSFPGTQLALFDQRQKTVLVMSALTDFDSVVRRVEPSISAGEVR